MTLPTEISGSTMAFAVALMRYGIAHKFALMPPALTNPLDQEPQDLPVEDNSSQASTSTLDDYPDITEGNIANRVKSLLSYGLDVIEPSKVAQRKLMPPLKNPPPNQDPKKAPNKYPVQAAKHYLQTIANVGLGEMISKETSSGRGKSSLVFRKRKYEELTDEARELVTKLKMTQSDYVFRRATTD